MPNLDNIRLWMDALRSGEYAQGTGSLHDTVSNTFCCLGVACDVAFRNGVTIEAMVYDGDTDMCYDGEAAFLPRKVIDWLGIESNNPRIGNHHAVEWNDSMHMSFSEIADILEREFFGKDAS
jgi:hypothetical protein